MKIKLTTKDLISAGAFGAIYLVLLTVLSSMILPIVPILYLATPLIAGIILGSVYMLYSLKVPRTGSIFYSRCACRTDYLYGYILSADCRYRMGRDCRTYRSRKTPQFCQSSYRKLLCV